jgi:hypothetical protein
VHCSSQSSTHRFSHRLLQSSTQSSRQSSSESSAQSSFQGSFHSFFESYVKSCGGNDPYPWTPDKPSCPNRLIMLDLHVICSNSYTIDPCILSVDSKLSVRAQAPMLSEPAKTSAFPARTSQFPTRNQPSPWSDRRKRAYRDSPRDPSAARRAPHTAGCRPSAVSRRPSLPAGLTTEPGSR